VVTRAAGWRSGASPAEKALAGRRVVRRGTTSRVGQAGHSDPGRPPRAKRAGGPARRVARDPVPGEPPRGAEAAARPAVRTDRARGGRAPSRRRRGALTDPNEPQATGRQPASPPQNEVGADRRAPPDQAKLDGQRGGLGRRPATLNGRRGRHHAALNGRRRRIGPHCGLPGSRRGGLGRRHALSTSRGGRFGRPGAARGSRRADLDRLEAPDPCEGPRAIARGLRDSRGPPVAGGEGPRRPPWMGERRFGSTRR
jgi:hypothetical protein